MSSTWEWRHVKVDMTHEPNPDWYGIREREGGAGILEAVCLNCEEVVVAYGSEPNPDEHFVRPGNWSVENGQPYWVDNETKAHYHPAGVQNDLDWATSQHAWRELAEAIWSASHPSYVRSE